MKNSSLFLSFLFVSMLSLSVNAQWIPQTAPGLPNSSQPQLIFSPVDDNVCWGKNNNNSQFVRTTDGGDNWNVSTVTGAAGLECSSISAHDADKAWIAMNDPSGVTSGGIFKTTDGGSNWVRDTTAFKGSGGHPNVIHFFDADNGLCVGNPRGGYWEIYTTTNGGSNWIRVPSGNIPTPIVGELGLETSPIHGAVNSFWFPTLSNSLYRTTDHGYTWTVADSVTGGPSQLGFGFAFKDDLNGLAADFYPVSVISRTTDGGETWKPIPYPSGLSTISSLFIVYAKGTTGSYIITSQTNLGGNPMMPGTAYSNDDGAIWKQVDNLPLGPAAFSDWNTGWACGINDTIWKWNSSILPVELTSFTAITIGKNVELDWQTATEINNKGFEIYRNGILISFVNGKGTTTEKQTYSFLDKDLSSGIYNYRLNQIDFDGTQKIVGEITVNLQLPEKFSLDQNYPNPFNPSTTITYSIPTSEFVSLRVFDLLGNEAAVLLNEQQQSGKHELKFDASELSSGTYFYTLKAGEFVVTKKLVLMK